MPEDNAFVRFLKTGSLRKSRSKSRNRRNGQGVAPQNSNAGGQDDDPQNRRANGHPPNYDELYEDPGNGNYLNEAETSYFNRTETKRKSLAIQMAHYVYRMLGVGRSSHDKSNKPNMKRSQSNGNVSHRREESLPRDFHRNQSVRDIRASRGQHPTRPPPSENQTYSTATLPPNIPLRLPNINRNEGYHPNTATLPVPKPRTLSRSPQPPVQERRNTQPNLSPSSLPSANTTLVASSGHAQPNEEMLRNLLVLPVVDWYFRNESYKHQKSAPYIDRLTKAFTLSESLFEAGDGLPRDMPNGRIPNLNGLPNLGNTCFINVVLQCLASCEPFMQYFLKQKHRVILEDAKEEGRNLSGTNASLTKGVTALLQFLWLSPNTKQEKLRILSEQFGSLSKPTQGDKEELTGTLRQTPAGKALDDFKNIIGAYCKAYRLNDDQVKLLQQDSQEFLMWLINNMHDDLKVLAPAVELPFGELDGERDSNTHQSIISTLFQGICCALVECNNCKYHKLKPTIYNCIQIQIPEGNFVEDYSNKPFTYLYAMHTGRYMKSVDRFDKYKVPLRPLIHTPGRDMRVMHQKIMDWDMDRTVIFQMGDEGFYDVIDDQTENIMSNKNLMSMLLPKSKASNETEYVNIIFSHVIKDNSPFLKAKKPGKITRPYMCTVSRQVHYDQLINEMIEASHGALTNRNAHFDRCILYLHNERKGTIHMIPIDKSIQMPLYMEWVEYCLVANQTSHKGAKFVRMYLEWEPSYTSTFQEPDPTLLLPYEDADSNDKNNTSYEYRFGSLRRFHRECQLTDCIVDYTKTEKFDYKCDVCASKDALITTHFNKLPNILVFNLKRFKSESYHFRQGKTQTKMHNLVRFPEEGLDMTPYCWPDDLMPENALEARKRFPEPIDPDEYTYDLFAYVNHKGEELSSGHYLAVTRNPVDGKWRLYDDMIVTECHPLQYFHNAYFLFYEKRSVRRARDLAKMNLSKNNFVTLKDEITARIAPLREKQEREEEKERQRNALPRIPVPNGPMVAQPTTSRGFASIFRRDDAARRGGTFQEAARAAANQPIPPPRPSTSKKVTDV